MNNRDHFGDPPRSPFKGGLKQIAVNPQALGSVEFEIVWECSSCHAENSLIRKGSLLAEQEVACSQCENIGRYEYDPGFEIISRQGIEKIAAIEKAVLSKFKSATQESILQLGQDFLFGVNTYFAKRLIELETLNTTSLQLPKSEK